MEKEKDTPKARTVRVLEECSRVGMLSAARARTDSGTVPWLMKTYVLTPSASNPCPLALHKGLCHCSLAENGLWLGAQTHRLETDILIPGSFTTPIRKLCVPQSPFSFHNAFLWLLKIKLNSESKALSMIVGTVAWAAAVRRPSSGVTNSNCNGFLQLLAPNNTRMLKQKNC